MSDLIKREDAINIVEEIETMRLKGQIDLTYAPTIKRLKSIPSARQKGKWISEGRTYPPTNEYHGAVCSICGTESEYLTNFCGECGADMRMKGADDE